MGRDASILTEPVAWGVASRVLPGETTNGDMHLLKAVAGGFLLSVVDGLGHGGEAAAAARKAIAILEEHAEEPLNALFQRCHEALINTRGVVMTVAKLQVAEGQLSWAGIGNVEAALFRGGQTAWPSPHFENLPGAGALGIPYQRATLLGGVVGYKLPQARAGTLDVFAGDLLVFATDGIDLTFTEALPAGSHPQQIADRILDKHFKGTDDALVLVVRYCETSSGSSTA